MNTISFETPENIVVEYRLAGPGTRYVAFFIDALILIFSGLLLTFVSVFALLALQSTGAGISREMAAIALSAGVVIFGFASMAYFVLFELYMDGQTPGKRMTRIRVVNEGGFSLHSGSIILREIFRIIDAIPILWIVPLLSKKFQRFGDMAAGTLVVNEESQAPFAMREQLAARSALDAEYRFSPVQLDLLSDEAIETVETFLIRRDALHPEHRERLAQKIATGVASMMDMEAPVAGAYELYLEELLAAYARREVRHIA